MTQLSLTEQILSTIGHLAETTIGEVIFENNSTIRLQQLNHIIEWSNIIRQDLNAQHNLRLSLEQQLNRQRTLLVREELLTNIDLGIQQHMKQLNVDVNLGSELLPRIMNVIDTNILPILQQFDGLRIHVDNIARDLNQAHARIQLLQNGNQQININESQTVTNSLMIPQHSQVVNDLHFANERIVQLQGIIRGLQIDNQNINNQLFVARNKNQQLVQQIVLSNSKLQQIENKLIQSSSKVNSSTNDIKIINDLKGQKQVLNKRINQLTSQITQKTSQYELQTQKLNSQITNINLKIKQLLDQLDSTRQQLLVFKNKAKNIEHIGNQNQVQNEQIIYNANQRIEQLIVQYSQANNRIAELQRQLQNNFQRKSDTQYHQEVKNVELTTQLAHSQHRIEELINQLSISNNRITDLQLDIEAMNRDSLDKNNEITFQRRMQAISHQLLISNAKVEDMMKMVSNYQNNVIDLELDKESLIFQLNDFRNNTDNYLDELKIERATVKTLKEQLLKIKQSYYDAQKDHIKGVQSQIFSGRVNESIQKPSVQGQIVNIYEPQVHLQIAQKNEISHRDHTHRKIFDGKNRESRSSNRRSIFNSQK